MTTLDAFLTDCGLGIVNLSRRGTLQESVAGGARSVNPERARCPAPKSEDREEEGGLSSLT
jgi:hypothetical protein